LKAILLVTLLFILLVSCQQTELQFSCDPDINQFVAENREELSQISVFEITTYDLSLQRAVFNSWDYQKRRSAWIDKFTYVLANGNFTDPETGHILKIINHIHSEYFLNEDTLQETREQFAADWINYAFTELNWTEKFVAFMVYRLYTDYSQLESELSQLDQLNETIDTDTETGDCDCNVSADFCMYAICTSYDCNILLTGCGWLWNERCDGLCI
jgi:hypothetical protein